jgi:O-Antigen ligase
MSVIRPRGGRWPICPPISLGMRLPILSALRPVPAGRVEGPLDLRPSDREPFVQPLSLQARLRPHLAALVPGLLVVGLMLVWAVHDGGYDAETWYWGSLAALGLLAATIVGLRGRLRVGRRAAIALALFAAYVGWCYLSITWASSPGDAFQGANQALLYLLVFAVMVLLPWTAEAALAALVVWVVGVGVIGVALLFRLASADRVASLVIEGRLAAPTGYFNSTAALFTIGALTAIALAARRELPGPLRGLLLAFACSGLQLALIVQSRGWLFTLPIVALVSIVLVRDRLRIAAATVLPVVGVLVIIHRLLAVYSASTNASLDHASQRAGEPALLICAGVFVLGTILAWADSLRPDRTLPLRRRRILGWALSAVVVIGLLAGGTAATHGHPFHFISRQWNGFSHPETFSTQTHFVDVGSSRYDFWRVSLDAFVAHPIGGLGEDNFGDYYITHRRTLEEPSSTHSFELRLLAQTGIVGFLLMAGFLIVALGLAVRARRRAEPLAAAIAAIALLPVVVWLIHGSIDWFWEMPALSGPALGFLGVAGALRPRAAEPAVDAAAAQAPGASHRMRPARSAAATVVGVVALVAGVIVLGVPYLSVREVSLGSDAAARNPQAALSDFATASSLNPLSSVPGRLAGVVALNTHQYEVAERRFQQSIAREPGGWFSWLGAGLAASAMGDRQSAARYFRTAYRINDKQPADQAAIQRVFSTHPLTSAEAFNLLVVR